MKSEVKKLDACVRELNIEVGQETLTKKLDEIYADISKKAKISGFRPGTAPREILEEHHGKLAQEELIKAIIPEALEKSMQTHGLVSYEHPEITDVSLKDRVLSFRAKVEVRPEIKLGPYKGLKIKRETSQVKEEEINQNIEQIAKERNRENDISDNLARSLGYQTLEELKETLRKQYSLRKQEESYQDALNQLLEQLLKNNSISVPQGLLKRQLERRREEARYRLKVGGIKEDEAEVRLKELEPQLKESCEKEVKIFLLLDEIAKKENLKTDDPAKISQRAIEFLFENAKWG